MSWSHFPGCRVYGYPIQLLFSSLQAVTHYTTTTIIYAISFIYDMAFGKKKKSALPTQHNIVDDTVFHIYVLSFPIRFYINKKVWKMMGFSIRIHRHILYIHACISHSAHTLHCDKNIQPCEAEKITHRHGSSLWMDDK